MTADCCFLTLLFMSQMLLIVINDSWHKTSKVKDTTINILNGQTHTNDTKRELLGTNNL